MLINKKQQIVVIKMAHKKIELTPVKTFKRDSLIIIVGPKNIIFDTAIDDCGNRQYRKEIEWR